ncbi:MAG: alpha/beta fold hydrolase BchO [Paracoccaceae bacterium]
MRATVHPEWERLGQDWPNRQASHFVEAGRIRWHYQRMGSGPVLLLLHGAGAATHSWRDLMPKLSQWFDVIAPDLPGHGFTRIQSRKQCSLPEMADGVHALLGALQASPALLVGHSAGAAIALQMALNGQAHPRLIIGLNPALAPFRGMAGAVFPRLARALALNPFVPWMFSSFASAAGQVPRLIETTGSDIDQRGLEFYTRMITRSEHVDGALSMMALWNLDPLLDALPSIDLPVHLIVGQGDRTVPTDEAPAIARTARQINVREVAALGHLMHEEDPELFAAMIKELYATTANAPSL